MLIHTQKRKEKNPGAINQLLSPPFEHVTPPKAAARRNDKIDHILFAVTLEHISGANIYPARMLSPRRETARELVDQGLADATRRAKTALGVKGGRVQLKRRRHRTSFHYEGDLCISFDLWPRKRSNSL